MKPYNSLQIREIFHLEFLRWMSKKMKADNYAVKGGCNLRFFFKSPRYSEDMDLDVTDIGVEKLKDIIKDILDSKLFQSNLKTYSIQGLVPPNMAKAKQTETTQRFKIHLLTASGEDLFTKVEFSRRRRGEKSIIGSVEESILRGYQMAPLLVSHYDAQTAIWQKITALSERSTVQARDIFDIYMLSTEEILKGRKGMKMAGLVEKATERIFEVSFEQFRDTVVSYLSPEDQKIYSDSSVWDEIRLKAEEFIKKIKESYG